MMMEMNMPFPPQLQADRLLHVDLEWQPSHKVEPRKLGAVVKAAASMENTTDSDPFPLTSFLKKGGRLQTLIHFNKAQEVSLETEGIDAAIRQIQNSVVQ